MWLLRFVGALLMLAGVVTGARDIWVWQQGAEIARIEPGVFDPLNSGSVPIRAGELWYMATPQMPNTVQAVVQRDINPALWDDVILPVLLFPAFAVFLILGFVLWLLGRLFAPRRKRRRLY